MEGIILLIVIVAIVTIVYAAVNKNNITNCYTRLAEHYSGTCEGGGWFSRPQVQFVHADLPVTVNIYSTGGEHPTYYTQVRIALPQPTVRCELYPEGMWSRFGKLMGMEDVEIGSPDFDDTYVIKGAVVRDLRELLTLPVQQQIERLRQFLGNNDIYVAFGNRDLLVEKRSLIKDFPTLLQYTELALQLYDVSARPPDEGIEFVGDAAEPSLEGAMCQICGDVIEDDVVFCRRCKTPHHQDCWNYYGACSTYGCREKKYLRRDSGRARRAKQRM